MKMSIIEKNKEVWTNSKYNSIVTKLRKENRGIEDIELIGKMRMDELEGIELRYRAIEYCNHFCHLRGLETCLSCTEQDKIRAMRRIII